MIIYPNKPWTDGQTFVHTTEEGQEITGTYVKADNTWSFSGSANFDTVYTSTVYTVDVKPPEESIEAAGVLFDSSAPAAEPNLVTQQDVNWYLNDLINNLEGGNNLWVNDDAPPTNDLGASLFPFWFKPSEKELYYYDAAKDEWILTGLMNFDRPPVISGDAPDELEDGRPVETGDFWFDTTALEVLINYNGQWFPVSIPPAQVEILRQELDALYQDTSQNKFNIALTQQELDGKVLELNEAREALKSEYDGKLATLEEELEQLAPSLERGSWNFTLNHPPGVGEYCMISAFLDEDDQEALCTQTYAECQAAAAGDPIAGAACTRAWDDCREAIVGSKVVTTDDWLECDELVFNDVDRNGKDHRWGGIDSDHYIDVFNMNDDNYMIGDIATHGGGTFSFDLISSKGVASGPCTVKIFKSEGTVDFDQYVRKQGDTMTGDLRIKPGSLKTMKIDSGENSNLTIRRNGVDRVVVRAEDVKFSGDILLENAKMLNAGNVATREYVLNHYFGAPYKWVPFVSYDSTVKNLARGEFTYDDDAEWAYISDYDNDGTNQFTNANRDTGLSGMLKVYTGAGGFKVCLKYKDIRMAIEETPNGYHPARYNIAAAFRWKDNLEAGTIYYLRDGAFL